MSKNTLSKEDLLRMYQTEASDMMNRKNYEKQDRINKERIDLDRLQMEMDQEKKTKLQSKANISNSQRIEYEKFINDKFNTREKSLNPRKKMSDPQGTYKIGGDNREIKRKNYEEITDNLTINPTRRENNLLREENYPREVPQISSRGKSQGYNIINHENNEKKEKENIQNNNYNSNIKTLNNPNSNNNLNNYNTEGLDNLENYDLNGYGYNDNFEKPLESKQIDKKKEPYNSEFDPDQDNYKKLYDEYLKKMSASENQQQMNGTLYNNPNQEREFSSKQRIYDETNSNNINSKNIVQNDNFYQNNHGNDLIELENNFNSLNIEQNSNNILYKKPTYHNMPSQENFLSGQQKFDKQKVYRDYLNLQIMEKGKTNPVSQEPVSRLNRQKNNLIQENPCKYIFNLDSCRNRNLGMSKLGTNPISNSDYNHNYNTNSRPNVQYNPITSDGRDTPGTREKLRMIGNNIMK